MKNIKYIVSIILIPILLNQIIELPINQKQDGKNKSEQIQDQGGDEEISIEITHIKFNHTPPKKTNDLGIENTTDGLYMRSSYKSPLKHRNHLSKGEWIKNNRNEPALYVAKVTPTIKVRLKISPPQNQKVITVFALRKNFIKLSPIQIGPFNILIPVTNELDIPNVNPGFVSFDARGISIGNDKSEYVEFSLSGPMRNTIAKTIISYEWFFNLKENSDDPAIFEKTGPHTFYTVHDRPQAPWNNNDKRQKPWINALEFSINKAKTRFRTNTNDIAQRVTLFIYREYDLKYDIKKGRSRFLIPNKDGKKILSYTKIINNQLGKTVNCDDVSLTLCATASILGLPADYTDISNFGYLKRGSLIGFKQEINSALDVDPGKNGIRSGLDTGVHPDLIHPKFGRINGDDNIRSDPSPHIRIPFVRHSISRIGINELLLYDACLGTKELLPYLKIANPQDYLDKTRDISSGREIDSRNNIDGDGNPVSIGLKRHFKSKIYEIK